MNRLATPLSAPIGAAMALIALTALIGLLISTPIFAAADKWASGQQKCTPIITGDFNNRLDIKCAEAAKPPGLRYFVLPKQPLIYYEAPHPPSLADASVAKALISTATRYNKPLLVRYSLQKVQDCNSGSQTACVMELSLGDDQAPPPPKEQPLFLTNTPCTIGAISVTAGLQLDCANLTKGVAEFALPDGLDASLAQQLLKQAKQHGQTVTVSYAADEKAGASFGCKVASCRPIHALSVEINVAKVVKDELEASVLSYFPPRLEPYLAIGRGNAPIPWDAKTSRFVYIPGPAKHYASTLSNCTLDFEQAANRLGNAYPPSVYQDAARLLIYVATAPAATYAAAKKGVVDAMVAGLVEIGVPCDATCRKVIEAGIDIALAAAGLPPSLPNAQAMMEGGASAIAGQVVGLAVAQIPGAPSELGAIGSAAFEHGKEKASQALQQAIAKGIVAAARSAICPKGFNADNLTCKVKNDDPMTWGTLDPNLQPFPAMAYVHIKAKKGVISAKLQRINMTVTVQGAEYIADQPVYKLDVIPPDGVILPVVLWPKINGKAFRATTTTVGDQPDHKTLKAWAKTSLGTSTEYWYTSNWDQVPTMQIPPPYYANSKSMTIQVNAFVGLDKQAGSVDAVLTKNVVSAGGGPGVAIGEGGRADQRHGSPIRQVCDFRAK